MQAGEMGQWVKGPAAKPDDLSLFPRADRMEGESSSKLSSDLHVHATH